MSAIEPLPSCTSPADRRREKRVRPNRLLAVRAGRREGFAVDLSLHGMRVRHSGTLLRGTIVRITFDWNRSKFAASAETLSSRLVLLGTREGEPPTYETRFRFVGVDAAAGDLLARVLETVTRDELRTWVGNLKGFEDAPRAASAPPAAGFVRCRRIGHSWEKKWTRDGTQPADGFLLPAGTSAADIEALCNAWMEMGAEARRLLQLTAEAVVQEAAG